MSELVLICFPPAGAGAAFFHAWRAEGIRVVPVELPGREKRFTDPPAANLGALADDVLPQLLAAAAGQRRVALFGHSFGALVAYLATARLTGRRPRLDVTLVASGAHWPGTPRPERASGLPDDEFVAAVRDMAGYYHPAWDVPELREVLLPALRSDVRLLEEYVFDDPPPLAVPVLAVRGRDDHRVSAADAACWRKITTGPFSRQEVDGGHMYLVDRWRDLLELVKRHLRTGAAVR